MEDDDDLSFTSLAKKAKDTVDLKRTLEETAKAKSREAKKASSEEAPKEDKKQEEGAEKEKPALA